MPVPQLSWVEGSRTVVLPRNPGGRKHYQLPYEPTGNVGVEEVEEVPVERAAPGPDRRATLAADLKSISAPLPQGSFLLGPGFRLLWDELKGILHSGTRLLSLTYRAQGLFF
jgi:hypothetical protein